jgi:hypothetical protein
MVQRMAWPAELSLRRKAMMDQELCEEVSEHRSYKGLGLLEYSPDYQDQT